MKYIILLLLLPIAVFGQNQSIGTYQSDMDVYYGDKIYNTGDSLNGSVIKKISRYKTGIYAFTRDKNHYKIGENHDEQKDYKGLSYTASNGITYKPGDKILLGQGSMPNGDFKYLQMAGWGAALTYNQNMGSEQFNIGKGYSGTNVILKKINIYHIRGAKKVIFVVGAGNITNYWLYIEDAIQSCEIKDCIDKKPQIVIQQQSSPADELLKYKKLLDEGAISQQEYDAQKKKLLQ